MPYTPVELRHVKIGRGLFGYKRAEVERILDDIADSFENVWRDRGELDDKVEELEKQIAEYNQREQLLTQTLMVAERAAADARESARKEAELIVAEAHAEARSVVRGVHAERERLVRESKRIQTLLRSALGLVEEGAGPSDWPDRSDTREFQAISPPEPDHVVEPEAVEKPRSSRDFDWG